MDTVKQRTQSVKMMRGLLAEFGIDIPEGLERALMMARQVIDGEAPIVPAAAVKMVAMLSQQALDTHAQLREIDRALASLQRTDEAERRPCHDSGHRPGQRYGVGGIRHQPRSVPLGSTVRGVARADAEAELQRQQGTPRAHYQDGRQVSTQASRDWRNITRSTRQPGIRPRGPALGRPADTKPVRLATVAMANRLARIVWAVLVRGEVYQKAHVPVLAG